MQPDSPAADRRGPQLPRGEESSEEHSSTRHVSLGTYYLVFAALMVLLVVTVVAAFFVHSESFPYLGILVALIIATVKAVLVVLYFMHVLYASRLTKIFVAAAFLWLAILFTLTFSDYLTRDRLPVSRGWSDGKSAAQVPDPAVPPRAPSQAPAGVRDVEEPTRATPAP